MKKNNDFFRIDKNLKGDSSWIRKPVRRLGGNRLQIDEQEIGISPGIQKALVDSSRASKQPSIEIEKICLWDMFMIVDYVKF